MIAAGSSCEGLLVEMQRFMTLCDAVRARTPRGVDAGELQRIARAP